MAAEPEEEHAIHYNVLPRGTPVEAADGTRVGTVEKAIHHRREHILDGIVIETPGGSLFVDAPEVARITNLRVTLTLDPAEVGTLSPYKRSWLPRR